MHLQHLRQKIDDIDTRIVQLISERLDWALCTNAHKTAIADKQREETIISRLLRAHGDYIPRESLEQIYRQLFQLSKEIQERQKTPFFFLGGHGGFSEDVCRKIGQDPHLVAVKNLREFCFLLKSSTKSTGTLALDNLSAPDLDTLWQELKSRRLHIHHILQQVPTDTALMVKKGANHHALREVWTTPSLCQMYQPLFKRLSLRPRLFACEGLAAIKALSRDNMNTAIVGHMACAELYSLEIISELSCPKNSRRNSLITLSSSPHAAGKNSAEWLWSRSDIFQESRDIIWQVSFPDFHQISRLRSPTAENTETSFSFSGSVREVQK